jgi:hypothetical protein
MEIDLPAQGGFLADAGYKSREGCSCLSCGVGVARAHLKEDRALRYVLEQGLELFSHVGLEESFPGSASEQQSDLHDVSAIFLALARMASAGERFELEDEQVLEAGHANFLDDGRPSADLVVGDHESVESLDVHVELDPFDRHLALGQSRGIGDLHHVLQDAVVGKRDHEVGVVAGFGRHCRSPLQGVEIHGDTSDEDDVRQVATELCAEI